MSLFLWATLLVMFSFLHFASVISGLLDYPIWVYNEASLFVIIFDLLYIATRMITRNNGCNELYFQKKFQILKVSKSTKKMYYLLWILLLASIMMVFYKSYKATGSIFSSSWGALLIYTREQDYVNAGRLLSPFFFPSAALLFLCRFCKSWKKYLPAVIVLLILNEIITRNRIQILPLLCFGIVLYLLNNKLTVKSILIFLFVGAFVIYVVYGLQIFRYYGTFQNFADNASFETLNNQILDKILRGEGELGLRNIFYYFISQNNNFDGFGEGHTYLRMLLFWLPTSWSGGVKPDDFAIAMGKALDPSSWGYSVHPTLYGDCYANFGVYGALMGIFWAVFVNVSDSITLRSSVILQYICVMSFACFFVIIGRGSVYNAFIWLISGLLVLFFVNHVLKKNVK